MKIDLDENGGKVLFWTLVSYEKVKGRDTTIERVGSRIKSGKEC